MLAGAQVSDERRQHAGEFLRLRRAGIVIADAVGRQRRDARQRQRQLRQRDSPRECRLYRLGNRALHGECADRIGAERAAALVVRNVAGVPYCGHRGGSFKCLFACDEYDGAHVQHHVFKSGVECVLGRRQSVTTELQRDDVHATVEIFEDGRVRSFRIVFDVDADDVPAEAVTDRFGAARKGCRAGHGLGGVHERVFARIERFDPEAVGCFGHQPLFEVSALQRLVDHRAPLIQFGGGEIAGELVVGGRRHEWRTSKTGSADCFVPIYPAVAEFGGLITGQMVAQLPRRAGGRRRACRPCNRDLQRRAVRAISLTCFGGESLAAGCCLL